jgi:hypothetical protein
MQRIYMTPPKRTCVGCGQIKAQTAFYWYKKQRTVLRKICHKCYAAWLLSDTSGKRITNAEHRGEITKYYAAAMRVKIASTRAATNEQRKAKLRDIATKHHEHRRFLEAEYGIRAATPTECMNPTYVADQAERRARYEADTAREQARRDKISKALTGRPRAPRAPSAADRLAAAARERSSTTASAGSPSAAARAK